PINFTGEEDENRNGTFEEEELSRVRYQGNTSQATRRYDNWSTFMRQRGGSVLQNWNRYDARHVAQRAISVITLGGTNPQDRTPLAGNAGNGDTSFWAAIDIDESGFIPHETGHTFGFNHTDDAGGACVL